jgi:ABC-type branched-subunit amino acid transport system ATPase component/ABC-type branched-subunit amino acid transport system permease subunit
VSWFALTPLIYGTLVGLSYGLLAVGLVLVYRSNKVLNFAHAQVGVLGAAVFALLVVDYGIPYWIGFVLACTVSAGVSAGSETVVVRRLRDAPRIMSVVATLGLGQFLLLLALVINAKAFSGATYPQPSGLPTFRLAGLLITPAYTAMLVLGPLLVTGLALFLRYSRYGVGIRAAAANPEAARLAGLSASRMSSLAWAIAGALSGFTAMLVIPTQGVVSAQGVGPDLLLRALAAAVLAGLASLPRALAAGVLIGVVQEEISLRTGNQSVVSVTLFGVILAGLLLQRGARSGREGDKGSWAAVQPWRPVPAGLRETWPVKYGGLVAGAAVLLLLLLVPVAGSNALSLTVVDVMVFAVIGVSVGLVTGLGGQLALGQFALAGFGAAVCYHYTARYGDYPIAFALAGLTGAALAVLIGLPALRVRGLLYAVATLGLAVASEQYLLKRPELLGGGVAPPAPFGTETSKAYFPYALATCALLVLLAANVRRSGFGRRLVATRDNEDQAKAFTVPATLVKLQGFGAAGFIAGVAGAVLSAALVQTSADAFPARASIDVVVLAVLGGLGVLAGPLLGALYTRGLPLLDIGNAGLAATALGALVVVVYFPNGLAGILSPLRDRALATLARRRGVPLEDDPDPAAPRPSLPARTAGRAAAVPAQRQLLLQAAGLSKRYGGVVAVDDVSLEVYRGETLGLLGPNGAGKTTTFELLGGFTRPDSGRIAFLGEDVTWLPPQYRARLGLIRSFQDAALFPTLTVLDTVMLSFERTEPSRLLTAVTGSRRAERDKERRARELLAVMGLERYRDKTVSELSTGTRRITELACCLAMQPRLLLLDEPSSGIAQRETEALGDLVRAIKAYLDTTIVIIEHDMPLLRGLSDRLIAMETGRVLAVGAPEAVLTHPRVVESYLGGDIVTIESSGTGVRDAVHCTATTRSGGACRRVAVADGRCAQHRRMAGASR